TLDTRTALGLAAAVERDSEHTIARGIVRSAEEERLAIPKAQRFEAMSGYGVKAVVDARELYVGGPSMLRHLGVTPAAIFGESADRAACDGQTIVYLVTPSNVIAALTVADAVRPESPEAIRRLHAQGLQVVMLTGDAKAVADAVAADLEIDTVFAEVLPGDKV